MAVKHNIVLNKDGQTGVKEYNAIKAIRLKCLDCSNFSSDEIKDCSVELCPLWPFRFGKDPGRQKRVMSDEQRAAVAERLRAAREKR